MYVFKRNQWESKKSYLDRWCGLLHAADYRKHTEIIASELKSKNVKEGKIESIYKQRAHTRNLWYEFQKWRSWYYLLDCTKKRQILYKVRSQLNQSKISKWEFYRSENAYRRCHRSQIAPQFSMHGAKEAALLKLSFVIKNHKNVESTSLKGRCLQR